MALFQGDIVIRQAILLILQDIRNNPWLITDIFSDFIENPLLKDKYGLKEIERAKEFILNNDIPVYMKHRLDKMEFPCVTISLGSSREDKSLATLGDLDLGVEEYSPNEINKPIKYIVSPFTPVSYDSITGILEMPESIEGYKYISSGMVLVDPQTGAGYIISGKAGNNGISIASGTELPNGKLAIVPQYQLYKSRRERAISQETYNIGCHAEGDPSTLIFLFSVIKYGLYRYREGLFEHENFQLSGISCSEISKQDSFGIENVFSRFISLYGQVEESWVKTPHRTLEAVDIIDGLSTGIKIVSQESEEADEDNDLWTTID